MSGRFTAVSVDAMKPDPERRLEVPDPAFPSLYLIVQPTGSKSWALRYRHAGRTRKLTLGKWPRMSLKDARSAASDAMDTIEHGHDPAAHKAQAKVEAERDTVSVLIGNFAAKHLAHLRSGAETHRVLTNYVVAKWGDRPVREIARRDVIELMEDIVASGRRTTANRVRAHLSKFFNWLVERDVIEASPVTGTRPPVREQSRERVLSDDEIRWLWLAAGTIGQPWGHLARFLLLTGQRLSEAAHMTDSEVRGDTWHLSSERTKNRRPHDVPLSPQAQAVLADLVRIEGSPYHFTTTGNTPVSGFQKARNRLAEGMCTIAEKERGEPISIPSWGFHDLRRTAATGMARLGIPVRVTEAALNHISGTGGGIVAVYQRHDYAAEKRNALEAWGRFVDSLVGAGEASNVVKIGKAQ